MSLATFGVLPDGAAAQVSAPVQPSGAARLPPGQLAALQAVDLSALRELTFPYGDDLTDTYTLTTAQGIAHVDASTGQVLGFTPTGLARQLHETIVMLHTGRGAWPLALLLGLAALSAPVLAGAGGVIWWRRRAALPKIRQNVGAQSADTIILVGSEGNSTWGFAVTLHAALTKAGHRVHAAPMNSLAPRYAQAKRFLILTATYGDGDAPESAKLFLARLERASGAYPVAVLGFGDRSFPKFCGFAEQVAAALRTKGWPVLLDAWTVDRQSAQTFAAWGVALGEAIGTNLELAHVAARPKTTALELSGRVEYGAESQTPTAILSFGLPAAGGLWQRRSLPRFEAGDLVGILAPGTDLPRFYSLASASTDGVLEICVRKQAGGLCSGFLHELPPGGRIEAFIRPNPAFRPCRGKAPVILIGAGTGIGPLAGFIRHNTRHRPMHLYWGGRHPGSDFLYGPELGRYVEDAGRSPRAGAIEDAFTESVDVMPTILQALGGTAPRSADGRSILPLLEGPPPADWRDALFYEYDFRDVHYSRPEGALGLSMDESALCVLQDQHYKYVHFAALPPLFFDLTRDPHCFENLAEDPAYAALVRDYAQKALSKRMRHAERTLTHFRATPQGLEERDVAPPVALPRAAE
jgi:sulfite reductase (NADPH) flavoprotein alpha-component